MAVRRTQTDRFELKQPCGVRPAVRPGSNESGPFSFLYSQVSAPDAWH